jgi:hypothetical protein
VNEAAPAARQGTEKRQRARLVAVRCTDAELAAIAAAAARVGMTIGAFMRHQAIGTPGPRAIRRPQVDRVELARVLAALGRYGSNVNQLARAANGGAIPLEHELAEAAAATLEMRDMLMRALGRGDGH